ncbi:MAG: dihydropteroate synthase, partial [Planctomycetota bacterium]
IALDPGFGFGKSVDDNYQLMRRLPELSSIGRPLLLGVSRKSFIGAITGVEDPRERLAGSVGAAVALFARGGRFFRVHDVTPHREAMQTASTIEFGPDGT